MITSLDHDWSKYSIRIYIHKPRTGLPHSGNSVSMTTQEDHECRDEPVLSLVICSYCIQQTHTYMKSRPICVLSDEFDMVSCKKRKRKTQRFSSRKQNRYQLITIHINDSKISQHTICTQSLSHSKQVKHITFIHGLIIHLLTAFT